VIKSISFIVLSLFVPFQLT